MAVSSIRVTEGSGPYIHTWQRSISSVNREQQYVLLAEPASPTFSVIASDASIATTGDHIITLNSGASTYTRIHAIHVFQTTVATAAATKSFAIYRTTTSAPSGGTSITPSDYDTADTVNATSRSIPTSKGTETDQVLRFALNLMQANPTTNNAPMGEWRWQTSPRCKPIIIPSGTTNGIAIKVGSGAAGATASVVIEFTESAEL